VHPSDNRSFPSDLAARLAIAVAWIFTALTILLLAVAAILIAVTPKDHGWDSLLGVLWILLALAALAVSSVVGTISAAIGLRARSGAQDRRSLRAALAINGAVLLASLAVYVTPSLLSRPSPREMFIRGSGVWFRPGDQETVTLQVTWNDGDDGRELPDADWSSSDTGVFTVAGSGMRAVITAVAPGQAMLRVTSRSAGAEHEVRVVQVAPIPPADRSTADPAVVISQFRLAGPLGADDDFVEVRNRAGRAVDISGWSVALSDGRGATGSVGRVPPGITLEPGCPYLFAGARPLFGDRPRKNIGVAAVVGDFPFWPAIDTDGGIALVDAAGRIVDQVGSAGSRYVEGTPLPSNAFAGGGGYTRTGDTNDNGADFAAAAKAVPLSFAATCAAYRSRSSDLR
jgi:hypothetical protein